MKQLNVCLKLFFALIRLYSEQNALDHDSLSSNLLLSASVTVCQVFSLSKFENPHQSLSSNEQTVPSWAEAVDKMEF